MAKIVRSNQVNMLSFDRAGRTYAPAQSSINDSISGSEGSEALIGGIIDSAKERSDVIKNKAKAEAADIIQRANDEREEVRRSAYEEGHNTGFEQGLEEGKMIYDGKIKDLDETQRSFMEEYYRAMDVLETEILDFAIAIAEKIVARELEKNETVLNMLREAFARLKLENSAVVEVGKAYYDKLADLDLHDVLGIDKNSPKSGVAIVRNNKNDEALKIKTGSGTIDLSVSTQIEEIKDMFK